MPRLVVTQARRVEDNSTHESTNGGHPVNDQQPETNPPIYPEPGEIVDVTIKDVRFAAAPTPGALALGVTILDTTGMAFKMPQQAAIEPAPAKTHDLTVHTDWTNPGVVRIGVENKTDDYRLYLPTAEAKQLGRMLGFLTPAQVAILAAELTGGAL
jgi:hypothetical protein